jgi:3-O-methylgallate 3,4-dioxygenase
MAEIVLGIGTSHTPLLALPGSLWEEYAQVDRRNPELVFPPDGWSMRFDEAVANYVPKEIQDRPRNVELFNEQADRCQRAIAELAKTHAEVNPDITIIVSDDQDEWFYESNMPMFAIFWGESVPIRPRGGGAGPWPNPEISERIAKGYGDVAMDVPVASGLSLHLIEYLRDHDFDISQFNYVEESYGGKVHRRYPTKEGVLDSVRETAPKNQGLPHGYSYVVKRMFNNEPKTILPVFQNTCYPPNQVTPRRCYQIGRAIADAVRSWDSDLTVAIVASGGLSHFVVDEELDRSLIAALEQKDAAALQSLPRHRLYSATSESMNWVTVGGAMEETPFNFELVDYIPVYRTEAGTGGGWCFGRWR